MALPWRGALIAKEQRSPVYQGVLFLFRIKICGITARVDGEAAFRAGADAVGFNFYVRSLRCISPEQANMIASALPKSISRVGVFVNSSVDEIVRTLSHCPLDYVQLHGNEPIEMVNQLSDVAVIRAMRLGEDDLDEVAARANDWLSAGAAAVILDSLQRPGEFGGSGSIGNWAQARAVASLVKGPFILAGGLDPENVRDAIDAVGPWGVDCASGVETFPGKKSSELMHQFVAAARAAFDANPMGTP